MLLSDGSRSCLYAYTTRKHGNNFLTNIKADDNVGLNYIASEETHLSIGGGNMHRHLSGGELKLPA